MITEATTTVYVRVNAANRRVIAVSDQQLVERPGKPVFSVASNQARLDYYIVENNPSATYGFTVRAATTEERTAADTLAAQRTATAFQKAQRSKMLAVKNFYDDVFIRRFFCRGFMTTDETMAAATYTGTNEVMVNTIKPLGIQIHTAYNEWRHTVGQPVIDAMISEANLGPDLDSTYTASVQAILDTFLTERGFDITIYCK